MYAVDEDFDEEDADFIFYDSDPLRDKKRLTLSDFLPKAKISEQFDWHTDLRAPEQPRLVMMTTEKQEKVFMDDLRLATMTGNLDVVKRFLTESKLPVDTLLKDDWTSLMCAANGAQDQVVLFLLESGADPNTGKKGFTPLMAAVCAASDCQEEVLEDRIVACITHLIAFGAKVNAVDSYRTTALHFAIKKNRIRVAKSLLDQRANVNAPDCSNATATHYAAKFGFGRMIRTLIDSGADLSLCDDFGAMPEDTALTNGFPQIGELLTRHRKDKSLSSPADLDRLAPVEKAALGNADAGDEEEDVAKVLHNDFQVFLRGFRLGDLEEHLVKRNLTSLPDVLKLKEEDLDKIGILSDRKKALMTAIESFSIGSFASQSPLPVPKKRQISSPELYNFLVNVTRQLKYIEASLSVVEHSVSRNPCALQKGMDAVPVNGLVKGFAECCNDVASIRRVLQGIDRDLKVAKKLGVSRPGLILEEDLGPGKKWISIPALLAGGALVCCLLYSCGVKHLHSK